MNRVGLRIVRARVDAVDVPVGRQRQVVGTGGQVGRHVHGDRIVAGDRVIRATAQRDDGWHWWLSVRSGWSSARNHQIELHVRLVHDHSSTQHRVGDRSRDDVLPAQMRPILCQVDRYRDVCLNPLLVLLGCGLVPRRTRSVGDVEGVVTGCHTGRGSELDFHPWIRRVDRGVDDGPVEPDDPCPIEGNVVSCCVVDVRYRDESQLTAEHDVDREVDLHGTLDSVCEYRSEIGIIGRTGHVRQEA